MVIYSPFLHPDTPVRDRAKICGGCGQTKRFQQFHNNRNAFDGKKSRCMTCCYAPVKDPKPKGNFGRRRRGKAERARLVREAAELRLQGWRYDRIAKALGIGQFAASIYALEGGGAVHWSQCPAGDVELAAYEAERQAEAQAVREAALIEYRAARSEGREPSWHTVAPQESVVGDELQALVADQAREMKWADKADFVNAKWRYSLDAPIKRMVDNERVPTTWVELLHAPEDSDPQKALERDELNGILAGLDEQAVEGMNEETLEHYREKLREAGYAGRGVLSSERQRLKTTEPRKGVSGRPERLEIPAEDYDADLWLRSGRSRKDRKARSQSDKARQNHDQRKARRNRGNRFRTRHNRFRKAQGVNRLKKDPLVRE